MTHTLKPPNGGVRQEHAGNAKSTRGGRYEVRIFDVATPNRAHTAAKNFILLNHYSVFEWPDSDHAVLVQVNRPNLSNVSISALTPDSEHIQLWNTVWAPLPLASTSMIEGR